MALVKESELGPESCICVAFGGGVNSTALSIELVRKGIVPAFNLFSDTGGEVPGVYLHIQIFSRWLVEHGHPPIITVRKDGRILNANGEVENLEENCLRHHMLPSIAYGYKTCSEKFKTRAQEKFLRHHPVSRAVLKAGRKLVKVIGYDAGEPRRAKDYEHKDYIYWYPLVEWGWDRAKCQQVVQENGFKPAKSSCFFCPAHTKPEIIELRDQHPELLERALRMEDNAKENLLTVKGLGRRFNWREFIEQLKQDPGAACKWEGDVETPCGCYDG